MKVTEGESGRPTGDAGGRSTEAASDQECGCFVQVGLPDAQAFVAGDAKAAEVRYVCVTLRASLQLLRYVCVTLQASLQLLRYVCVTLPATRAPAAHRFANE
eukprot:1184454-Prorocentrum_minimum.AAC.5